ncbi:hypothetical protein SJA_C1-09200 [Sphingobium indicum UT26S]|uniref:Uncharacterized protein n=1 Tax=Sphingobium indicum (strain DSM 16413 / CCM 7287 / MTCC 6362 / UT26 / NBRC 101211 / UT26S) TaxID=452662 RepID=D4YZH2_SPHIU|nr:hypothetical protein SJA_C1-09200 [Sphingobium indicum UT26S]
MVNLPRFSQCRHAPASCRGFFPASVNGEGAAEPPRDFSNRCGPLCATAA